MKRKMARKDFLKAAGVGVAGTALLGTSALGTTGCDVSVGGGGDMNVVVVMIDSLRKDHVGAYGNDWIQTPNLDALAGESLLFERAYPESIPTICSRRSLHTGVRAWPFRDWRPLKTDLFEMPGWMPIREDQTTLAEALSDAGYTTMFVTDVPHQFRPSYNMHRGFRALEFVRGQERDFYRPQGLIDEDELRRVLTGGGIEQDDTEIVRQHFANTRGREAEEDWFAPRVFSQAMDFVQDASRTETPFFLLVDAYDPHEPWDPPEEYLALYDEGREGPRLMSSRSGRSMLRSEQKLDRLHNMYSAEVTLVDRWLGRFTEKLRELELSENTVMIVLSDHGHLFGEHGFAGKVATALYPELTDIVFMIRHPEGKRAGDASDLFASSHDVPQTVLGMLGMDPLPEMNGQDLSGLFDGNSTPQRRDHFTLGYRNQVFARDEDYAMFAHNSGSDAKLFDLDSDPAYENNIAATNRDVVDRMFNDYILGDAGGEPLPRY